MRRQPKYWSAKNAFKILIGLSLSFGQYNLYAQESTSHSPYSKFGIGQMREDLFPQTRSMGGISSGIRYQAGLPVLNIANPASYTAFSRTILEAGLYGNITQLQKGDAKDHTADFAFSHFAYGVPLAKAGGLAFGLMPYSDVGYNSTTTKINGPLTTRETISGDGGVNKAFFGYAVSPFKGFSIGANVGFLFGELKDKYSVEFPTDPSALNTTLTETRLIRGATVDYGVQYSKSIGKKMNLTVGYSGALDNTVTNKTSNLIVLTQPSLTDDVVSVPVDSLPQQASFSRKINLPLKHSAGFTLSKGYNWLIGADFKYADWSKFQTRQGEQKLGKNYGVAIGGQIKPDPTSFKYLNQVDYRLGFRYNQSHIKYNNENINDMAVTVGVGLPLPETNFGFTSSRINISAEFGQQGTLNNNLVRERYVNINVGFTLNDAWFRRRSYD